MLHIKEFSWQCSLNFFILYNLFEKVFMLGLWNRLFWYKWLNFGASILREHLRYLLFLPVFLLFLFLTCISFEPVSFGIFLALSK